ncbi:DNA mismatch repair protein msh6 [Terramyces sp. JEL0728]|nr:DNA mismatch repair protein msh6 [Terramyces sp. JEL0728]
MKSQKGTPNQKKQTTLTSFFTPKTPKTPTHPKTHNVLSDHKKNVETDDNREPVKNKLVVEESEKPTKKQKRNVVISDDEDMEVGPVKFPSTPAVDLNSFKMSPSPRDPKCNAKLIIATLRKIESTPSKLKPQSRTEKFKEKNEERYSWLLDVRDENKRTVSDPDHDPRTLYVPKSAWNSFTPFEKQFWEIKSKHWDTVVFFKKGKFFELYENDADIGHQQFDLKLTDRVNMRMVGVPESSFHHWASQFIAKGYKVAKVEQMENAIGKSIRDKETPSKKDDKIIRRELTSVLTSGTIVDGGLLTTDMSTFCMSIKEEQPNPNLPPHFGISFVDTATSEFNVSYFQDDISRTQFETLITQVKPKELVLEKGGISKESMKILRNNLDNPLYNFLTKQTEFWNAEITTDELNRGIYFKQDNSMDVDMDDALKFKCWPEAIQKISKEPVALSAFGGLLSYLRTLKLDRSLLSASNIHSYDPVRSSNSLILDGQTLINLEIFQNTNDGGDKGTLFKLLNHCSTPFGKRLFKRWLCYPLQSVEGINRRLDAIEDLIGQSALVDDLKLCLKKLPDLERVISRIHSGNCLVKDFVNALKAFESIKEILGELGETKDKVKSRALLNIINFNFPKVLEESIQYFNDSFDQKLAFDTGKIQLNPGYDETYDEMVQTISKVEQKLEQYKKECEKKIGCKIAYKDIGKEIYQLEVPLKQKVPNDWNSMSKTSAVNRYYTSNLRNLINDLLEAREHCESAMRTIKTRVYGKFDENYDAWMKIINNIGELDCLFSLAQCTKNLQEPVCRPEFIESSVSVLEMQDMRHPCVMESVGSDYIPNDVNLGGDNSTMILLTGPNMGGKSTLLRQTCIAVIMAQLGCFVPASKFRLAPFDRIFTRIGANDNIMAGQSTFMVELSETSKILKDATPRSLVILDELGRGTSTFDGYAIAYAVLYHLIVNIGCLGLFSTHYGTLTDEFEKNPLVSLKYMSFHVDQESKQVVFLYKLVDGKCPESYGMNVAKMANIPSSIVAYAEQVAEEFEKTQILKAKEVESDCSLTTLASFKGIVSGENLKNIWKSLQ